MTQPASAGALAFDARPLTDPVDPKAVSAFVAEMKALRTRRATASTVIGIVAAVIGLLIAIPLISLMFIGIAMGGFRAQMLVPLLVIAVIAIAVTVIGIVGARTGRVARYRINRFAAANHMTYVDRVDDPPLPGMIFHIGNTRNAQRLVRGSTPRFVEFGNYSYTVKSGKNSTTYRWGYVAVKLNVPLPNIVLDAVGNNGFGTNLPASFDRDQRLSLEGDFDRYFTLYCPEGYERDALYLFTPDVMARFIDSAAELDVEIVDDWLFLYTRREASTVDPATWAWLFGAVGALITKFDQWERWRDERLTAASHPSSVGAEVPALPFVPPTGMVTPPAGVAQSGRRLKRANRWWVLLAIAAVVVAATMWMNAV